jgi:hypothetical protein
VFWLRRERELVTNFGGNLRFRPRHRYAPRTEDEVLDLLDRHAGGKVRVVGALHSWSPSVVSDDVLVDLRHFDRVAIEQNPGGEVWVTAGAGCRIHRLLRRLHTRSEATLPTLGMITEQTIGGAVATATHGSGRHSLSHYMEEIRAAAYDPDTGKARIYVWNDVAELRAARCALGCMGIVLSVRFRAVPKYDVVETIVPCATLDEVLAGEGESPLQQFILVPHLWSYFVQRRAAVPASPCRSWSARLYRLYWFWCLNVGFHLLIKLLASVVGSPALIRWFFRRVLPLLAITNRPVVDRSDRILVMRHELFGHLGTEIFVPAAQLRPAVDFVRHVVAAFDDPAAEIPDPVASALNRIGMEERLRQRRGTFTLHYPIGIRRVLEDDTLLSMSSGSGEASYALSFITYAEPREPFLEMASFLAESMSTLFGARLHWGKYYPLGGGQTERLYPGLEEFRCLCRKCDPRGVFRNDFLERVLGFGVGAENGSTQGADRRQGVAQEG